MGHIQSLVDTRLHSELVFPLQGALMARTLIAFTVHVFRPNGWFLIKYSESATSAKVAVKRAKKRIQRQGRLAHFYTFVAIESN